METKNGRAVLSRRRARGRQQATGLLDERAVRNLHNWGSGGEQSFPHLPAYCAPPTFEQSMITAPAYPVRSPRRLRREGAGTGVRIGLTVPKALGGVIRNCIKRRLRAAFGCTARTGIWTGYRPQPRRCGDIASAIWLGTRLRSGKSALVIGGLRIYKRWPMLPSACRFEPTCSVYMISGGKIRGGRGVALEAHHAVPPLS